MIRGECRPKRKREREREIATGEDVKKTDTLGNRCGKGEVTRSNVPRVMVCVQCLICEPLQVYQTCCLTLQGIYQKQMKKKG